MRAVPMTWTEAAGWSPPAAEAGASDLVLYFGDRDALARGEAVEALASRHPSAAIIGCTTGGQIAGRQVREGGVDAVAVRFEHARARLVSARITKPEESFAIGERLGAELAAPDLGSVLVISDGLKVNGSALVEGIRAGAGPNVGVAGGLAGDGARFETTLVGAGGRPVADTVAAVGFHGASLKVGHGSAGGWDVFGPKRKITKSAGNVLYELDGGPALDLYERYLGPEESRDLPGSALLFPLRIANPGGEGPGVVRTVLAIDRAARSMTFAGDMPEGWVAQLMRGVHERLVEGAADAARRARDTLGLEPQLSILVSCIGRKLLMGQRIGDEVEAAIAELGERGPAIGFYSYGEISPLAPAGYSELHNQTMTVMTLAEVVG